MNCRNNGSVLSAGALAIILSITNANAEENSPSTEEPSANQIVDPVSRIRKTADAVDKLDGRAAKRGIRIIRDSSKSARRGVKVGTGDIPGLMGDIASDRADKAFLPHIIKACRIANSKSYRPRSIKLRSELTRAGIYGGCGIAGTLFNDHFIGKPIEDVARAQQNTVLRDLFDVQQTQSGYPNKPTTSSGDVDDGQLPHNRPLDNTNLEDADRFTNETPPGLADPDTSRQGPATIPFSAGEGIKCGPISAAERAQLHSNEFYVAEEESIKWDESYLPGKKNSMVTMGDENGQTISAYEWNRRRLRQRKDNLKKMLIELRDQNGHCPAPIGVSAQQSPAGNADTFGNGNRPNSVQSNDNNVPSGGGAIPNGCVRIQSGFCQCGGDVRQC